MLIWCFLAAVIHWYVVGFHCYLFICCDGWRVPMAMPINW